MKLRAWIRLMAGLFVPLLVSAGVATPPVHLALAVHSEDPYHLATPDYLASRSDYIASRAALLRFSQLLSERGIAWNWQSDWNFLLAARRYEVDEPDATLLSSTGGTNIVLHLHRNLGVEMDPHSHENDGYNFADVAYLLTRLGVEPSSVVGGHVWDPSDNAFQDWPRLTEGLASAKYPGAYIWTPRLLMGEGTGQHRNDRAASGLWRPMGVSNYFTHANGGPIAAFGGWSPFADPRRSPLAVTNLIPLVQNGTLPPSRMWTAALVLGQSDFVAPGWFENTLAPMLQKLGTLRDSGAIRFIQLEEAFEIWQATYAGEGAVYLRGGTTPIVTNTVPATGTNSPVYVTFSLNTQDFAYPDLSADLVDRVLTLHEETGVPLDLFLASWMVDLYSTNHSDLLFRLTNSPVVALSYHTRPPLPYRVGFDWMGLGSRPASEVADIVRNYETHGIDRVTGQPGTGSGGYSQLKSLAGHPPFIVGAESDAGISATVTGVFRDLGARFQVQHGRAINLGVSRNGLLQKPEHDDLRLFEKSGQEPASILSEAAGRARGSGGTGPLFVGVKMHDNDFFAEDSAWLTTYLHRLTPPWNTSRRSPLVSTAVSNEMWRLYEGVVRQAAAHPESFTPINARGILALLGHAGPGAFTLQAASPAQAFRPGTEVGRFTPKPDGVYWRLIPGDGDDDNARFSIDADKLIWMGTAAPSAPGPLRFRVRAMDSLGLIQDQAFTVVVPLPGGGEVDSDGDGMSDSAEASAGTDPFDATSVLRAFLERIPDGFRIRWSSVPGRSYVIQKAGALTGSWTDLAKTTTDAVSTESSVSIPSDPEGAYFRVRLQDPP